MTEVELAKQVIDWLKKDNWEVYQEVQIYGWGTPTADIVAVGYTDNKIPLIWIIECKTSFGIAVAAQADYWRRNMAATYVSVAIPNCDINNNRGHAFLYRHIKELGLGIILARHGALELLNPKVIRSHWSRRKDTLNMLMDAHKDYAEAGNPNGKKLTPFGITSNEVVRHVSRNPGCTIKEVLDNIYTHYSSRACASGAILSWISKGVIPGIKKVREGRVTKLYLQGND
jgi:hypothetical protein